MSNEYAENACPLCPATQETFSKGIALVNHSVLLYNLDIDTLIFNIAR